MNSSTTTIAKTYLNGWLEGEAFQDFIREYFYQVDDSGQLYSIEEICRKVFWDEELYRGFLRFCKEHDTPFVDTGKNCHYKKTAMFIKFEEIAQILSQVVSAQVRDLLWLQSDKIELFAAREHIPGTSTTYWWGQMAACYKGISISSRGEVLYYLWDENEFYRVYSRKSWIHVVDREWNVIDLLEENIKKRDDAREQIQHYREMLKILKQSDYSNDDALRLLEEKAEYLAETGVEWRWENLDIIHFKSWLWNKLRSYEKIFQKYNAKIIRLVVDNSQKLA